MTAQGRLKLTSAKKSNLAKALEYDAKNLAIAKEFIADPNLCGGPESFGMIWARLVVERLAPSEAECRA